MIDLMLYKEISFKIAKPAIEEIKKTLDIKYPIKILVGKEEISREGFEKYYLDGATPRLKNNIVYILVGEEYFQKAFNTTKERKGDIPFPIVIIHEYLHIALKERFPETQKGYGFKEIIGEDIPLMEFWTELFTYLFWKKIYGEEIPGHKYKLSEIVELYANDIKEIIEENDKENEWWIKNDEAYLFGDLVGKILWEKYKEISITFLIEKLDKYEVEKVENVISYEILKKASNEYKKILRNISY